MKDKKIYLTSEEIFNQWCIWRDSAEKIEDRVIPDMLALQIQKIAVGLSNAPRFKNYPWDVKDDMVSSAMIKCIKNLKNVKEEKKKVIFNYFTLCSQCAFYEVIGKYYKHKNLIEQLTENFRNSQKNF